MAMWSGNTFYSSDDLAGLGVYKPIQQMNALEKFGHILQQTDPEYAKAYSQDMRSRADAISQLQKQEGLYQLAQNMPKDPRTALSLLAQQDPAYLDDIVNYDIEAPQREMALRQARMSMAAAQQEQAMRQQEIERRRQLTDLFARSRGDTPLPEGVQGVVRPSMSPLDLIAQAAVIEPDKFAGTYLDMLTAKPSAITPYTDAGKAALDLQRGLITKDQYDAIAQFGSTEKAKEAATAEEAAKKAIETQREKAHAAIASALEALAFMGDGNPENADIVGRGTGIRGQLMSGIKSSDAGTLKSIIDTLTSKTTIDTLMAMKEASKTGATGFGALNEKELDILISNISKLDVGLRPEVLAKNLGSVINQYNSVLSKIGSAAITPNGNAFEVVP